MAGGVEGKAGWTPRSAYTVALLTLIYAFNATDRNLFGLLVPLIKEDMELSDTVIGLLSGLAFGLFYATAALPIASLADRWNRRNIIGIGLAFWSLMTALHGVVSNAIQLAITRFLLGAGEASSVAPSNSIVADLFEPAQRPLALSVLAMATSIGVLVAFPILGWVSEDYGWRVAFVAAGVPGIVLAGLFYLTVREPVRRAAPGESQVGEPVPLVRAVRYLAGSRAFLFGAAAGTFVSMNMAITHTWVPTLLSRVHDLGQSDIGALMGFLRGPGGIVGGLAGGWLTTVLGRRDERWLYGVPAVAMLLIVPAQLLLLFGASGWIWQLGLALETMLLVSTIGPLFALLLATAQPRMRSVAIALFLFVSNLVGQGSGPLVAGMISDALAPSLGDEAIRYAMLTAVVAAVFASMCCLAMGRYIGADRLRRLPQARSAH
jgi:MFS family permease